MSSVQTSLQDQSRQFTFKHPFTGIISGPTSCGKTYLMKEILQRNSNIIISPPQRIIWLYKRWQPLYDVILTSIKPRVEFIQGLPIDLEKDTFLDINVRNLIILDDLMSTAAKDPRINDLFTEGSHHRNLSIMAINQNIFFSKDPTQRRNCHYMILFNNPMDKQHVMALARQMYPANVQYFMRHFEEATAKAYGHLVLDLKPTTPEDNRLRINALNALDQSRFKDTRIKKDYTNEKHHSLSDTQKERTHSESRTPQNTNAECENISMEQENSRVPSCDDCGIMFVSIHDLQNHIKTWCPENHEFNLKRKHENEMDNVRFMKRTREVYRHSPGKNEGTDDDSSEDKYFKRIVVRAKNNNEEEWQKKKAKYIENGLSKKEAEEKAYDKINVLDITEFLNEYGRTIRNILELRNGSLHAKVMDSIRQYMLDGFDQTKAIRMTLRKFKHELEEYFEDDDNTDNISEVGNSDEDDDDDDDGDDNDDEDDDE